LRGLVTSIVESPYALKQLVALPHASPLPFPFPFPASPRPPIPHLPHTHELQSVARDSGPAGKYFPTVREKKLFEVKSIQVTA